MCELRLKISKPRNQFINHLGMCTFQSHWNVNSSSHRCRYIYLKLALNLSNLHRFLPFRHINKYGPILIYILIYFGILWLKYFLNYLVVPYTIVEMFIYCAFHIYFRLFSIHDSNTTLQHMLIISSIYTLNSRHKFLDVYLLSNLSIDSVKWFYRLIIPKIWWSQNALFWRRLNYYLHILNLKQYVIGVVMPFNRK